MKSYGRIILPMYRRNTESRTAHSSHSRQKGRQIAAVLFVTKGYMKIYRAYKTELDPNNKQRTAFIECAGLARFVWNWGLARRIQEYKETGKSSSAFSQSKQLNAVKHSEYPWMLEYSKHIPDEALKDIDLAYKNFWRGLKGKGRRVGFPKFKSKKKCANKFTVREIRVFDDAVQLPRLGKIRLHHRGYIPVGGVKLLSATVSERAGRWFVSVLCETEIPDTQLGAGTPIGIDLGVKSLAVTSDGRSFENPKALRSTHKKLRRLQRELSRRKNGSFNREKTRAKIAALHYHISNIRKDVLHKATSAIVKAKIKPSAIVLEDLNVSGMVKNRSLARAILDVGMSEFRRQIEYKAKWNNVRVIIANRFYPSSKTCSSCGLVNFTLTLSDRSWVCLCGAVHDRDVNAAINLSKLAISTLSSRETLTLAETM